MLSMWTLSLWHFPSAYYEEMPQRIMKTIENQTNDKGIASLFRTAQKGTLLKLPEPRRIEIWTLPPETLPQIAHAGPVPPPLG